MRNAMNIYSRKDGRYEGRIPLGYDKNGKIKYKYLYSQSLSELKKKMLYAYAEHSNFTQTICEKTLKELCDEWLASAKLRVKKSSYCCYEKLINKHILPYFENICYGKLSTPVINEFSAHKLKCGRVNGFGGLSAKSVHDILVVMRFVAKYAEREYGYRNPMRKEHFYAKVRKQRSRGVQQGGARQTSKLPSEQSWNSIDHVFRDAYRRIVCTDVGRC